MSCYIEQMQCLILHDLPVFYCYLATQAHEKKNDCENLGHFLSQTDLNKFEFKSQTFILYVQSLHAQTSEHANVKVNSFIVLF